MMFIGKGTKRATDEISEMKSDKRTKTDATSDHATAPAAANEKNDAVTDVHVITLGKASLRLTITLGKYGPVVRLMRGDRFITYSGGLWHKIRRYVPQMKREGFSLQLTVDKDVTCETFAQNGKMYVKFHAQWNASQWDGKGHTFINFDEEEWSGLVHALYQVDAILATPVVEDCDDCNIIKQVVPVGKDGRTRRTMLDVNILQELQQSNAAMPEPCYQQCEYCGEVKQDRCHCHEEECRLCNIDNYCNTCGACKILAVESREGEEQASSN